MTHAVTEWIPQQFNLHPIHDIQVLTPLNDYSLGTLSLNSKLQALLNGGSQPKVTRYDSTYAVGDKVIQNTNNYNKHVYNGGIGIIDKTETTRQSQKHAV